LRYSNSTFEDILFACPDLRGAADSAVRLHYRPAHS